MVKYLLSFLIFFSISLNSQTELKFNLASAPFLVPNIGIEIQISERFVYQLDTSASFYDDIEGSPFHMTQIFNELRFSLDLAKIIFLWIQPALFVVVLSRNQQTLEEILKF